MSEPILLSGFSNTYLTDLKYHFEPEDYSGSFIEIIARNNAGKIRHLRFEQISNFSIDKGFDGNISGMAIIDIKERQWGDSRIEVQNFEQDPGITFLAKNLLVLDDEFGSGANT